MIFGPSLVREVLNFHYSREVQGWHIPQHVHHFVQLDVVLEGCMIIQSQNHPPLRLGVGQGTIIPPRTLHGYDFVQTVQHATFKFHVHYTCLGLLKPTLHRIAFEPLHLDLCHATGRDVQNEALWTEQIVRATTISCLVHALRNSKSTSDEARSTAMHLPRLTELIERVSRDPLAPWTVKGLANDYSVSPGHLTRCFREGFGETPQKFLIETRMRAASDILCQGDEPIKLLAERCGYATVHAFSRAFRQTMGLSPAAYRLSQTLL